jgi:hypothetical protein
VPGTIDNVSGLISFTADALIGAVAGVSGNGVLATLNFTGIAGGSSPISLENVTLLDSNFGSIDFTSSDGSVTVVQIPEPSPAVGLSTGLLALFTFRGSKYLAR